MAKAIWDGSRIFEVGDDDAQRMVDDGVAQYATDIHTGRGLLPKDQLIGKVAKADVSEGDDANVKAKSYKTKRLSAEK